MSTTLPLPNFSVNSVAVADATLDATDTGYAWGYQDATEGKQQCGSAYFPMGSPAWAAYNEGYKTGCIHHEVFTGVARFYVEFPTNDAPPAIIAVPVPATFPWETADDITRKQIEDEIHSDAEFKLWYDGLMDDMLANIEMGPVQGPQPDLAAGMGELEFLDYTMQQIAAGTAPKTLIFTEEMLSAIEDEHIGFDFCQRPYLY
jgi:hypothetical protein